jgi:hypothetical protein
VYHDGWEIFQLAIPNFERALSSEMIKSFVLTNKGKFYFGIRTGRFSERSAFQIHKVVNGFDLRPSSITLRALNPTSSITATKTMRFSFQMVRHVFSPTVTLLLPLWTMAMAVPASWEFELEPVNDALTYLATILIALVAHRGVMQEQLKLCSIMSRADVDFLLTVLLLMAQTMLLLLSTYSNYVCAHAKMVQRVQLISVAFWIIYRLVAIAHTASMIRSTLRATGRDLLLRKDHIGFFDYVFFRMQQQKLSSFLTHLPMKLKCKTFMGTNLKLLMTRTTYDHSRPVYTDFFRGHINLKQRGQHSEHSVKLCDEVFQSIIDLAAAQGKPISLLHMRYLPSDHNGETVTADTAEARFAVFLYEDDSGYRIPFEVQMLLRDYERSHNEYKRAQLKRALERNAACLSTSQLFSWFLQSLFLNMLFCDFEGMSNDRQTFKICLSEKRNAKEKSQSAERTRRALVLQKTQLITFKLSNTATAENGQLQKRVSSDIAAYSPTWSPVHASSNNDKDGEDLPPVSALSAAHANDNNERVDIKIFCDLINVLAELNFDDAKQEEKAIDKREEPSDNEFSSLRWLSGGRMLWIAIAPLKPTILTSIPAESGSGSKQTAAVEHEKRRWCCAQVCHSNKARCLLHAS